MSHTDGESTFSFETNVDTTLSRKERARRIADEYMLAPARILWSDYRARIGLLFVTFYVLVGTIGVIVVPEPVFQGAKELLPPLVNMQYPLGTDIQGRGLLRQMVHSTPEMLIMITAGAMFSTAVATVVGTVSGYKGGTVDTILTNIVDMVMTIPTLPLVIVLAATIQPKSPITIGLVLSLTVWASLSRTIRSQVLSLREKNYIESSRTMGLSMFNILAKDVTPNIMPYVMVNFVQAARNIIFASVALYFLGFLPAEAGTTANWGVTLNLAYNNGALTSPRLYYWFAIPMIAIVTLSYGLILFGQGTDRLFNPRIRARHAKTVDDKTDIESQLIGDQQ